MSMRVRFNSELVYNQIIILNEFNFKFAHEQVTVSNESDSELSHNQVESLHYLKTTSQFSSCFR